MPAPAKHREGKELAGSQLENSIDEDDRKGQNHLLNMDDIGGQMSSLGSPPSPHADPNFENNGNPSAHPIPQFGNPPPNTKQVLANVEGFLLPKISRTIPWYRGVFGPGEMLNTRPDGRLMDVLYQVALADQIRTFQAFYRDAFDEHQLFLSLREKEVQNTSEDPKHASALEGTSLAKKKQPPLHTKVLMSKITEGRIRAVALCRLCYGDTSLEILRATVDLASAYAMQGMWEQVSEQLAMASSKLVSVATKQRRAEQLRITVRARSAASKVACTYRVLRTHAMQHRGQVTKEVLQELAVALGALTYTPEEELLLRARKSSGRREMPAEISAGDRDDGRDASLAHPTQLVALLHGFFGRFAHPNHPQHTARSQPNITSPVPSWGQVVDFLREDCPLMQAWQEDMQQGVLPQNRAALYIPFVQSDAASRGIGHPAQAAFHLSKSPAVAKVLSGNQLSKKLQSLKVEMPLWINPRTGEIKKLLLEQDIPAQAMLVTPQEQFQHAVQAQLGGQTVIPGVPRYVTEHDTTTPTQTVLYELPVLWEEIIAMHVLDLETDPIDLLRAQVMTLLGVCHIFSNKLTSAEESMREALRQMEAMGLEQEAASCELYNSIAQLMIVKHREWQTTRKERATQEATDYLTTESGTAEIKTLYAQLKKDFVEKAQKQTFSDIQALMDAGGNKLILSKDEREQLQLKAQSTVFRKQLKECLVNEKDPTLRAVEAAFRYLVRAYEIVSEIHGPQHAASATASLAVASVQNTVGNHESAREWLTRALRAFEKLDPTPHRAVAFVQMQLSQVLAKQGHSDEALCVLDKATAFHVTKSKEGIAIHLKENGVGFGTFTPVLAGTALHDDVTTALSMIGKVCRMVAKRGGKWQAAEQAEVAAGLAEGAFGWDSVITGEALRECGTRYVAISDWKQAAKAFKRAQEAFEAINGKECKKALSCLRSYNRAIDRQKQNDPSGVSGQANPNPPVSPPTRSGPGRPFRPGSLSDRHDEQPQARAPNKIEAGKMVFNQNGVQAQAQGIDHLGVDDVDNSSLKAEDSPIGGTRGRVEGKKKQEGGGGSQGSSLTASPQASPPDSPVHSAREVDEEGPVQELKQKNNVVKNHTKAREDHIRDIESSLPGMVSPWEGYGDDDFDD